MDQSHKIMVVSGAEADKPLDLINCGIKKMDEALTGKSRGTIESIINLRISREKEALREQFTKVMRRWAPLALAGNGSMYEKYADEAIRLADKLKANMELVDAVYGRRLDNISERYGER